MDGKDIRGAPGQTGDGRRMMVAAAGHGTGLVLRQAGVGDRSNGIPAVRALSGSPGVTGRTVTMDATRARHGTVRSLPGRRADHPVTAARDNQETIHDDLRATGFTGAPWHETVDRGHGRPGRRRCDAVDLSGAEWDGQSALHGRRQAIRAGRGREVPRTGGHSPGVTWCLTSPGPERAGPEELPGPVRNHWTMENRVHHLRDFTCDGDRCRAHVRNLPRNLSCLTNAAIAIVRCDGRFGYMPEANRHQSARAQEAPGLILGPPGK